MTHPHVETAIFERQDGSESARLRAVTTVGFSDNEQAMQRLLDGELGTGTAQGVQEMINGSSELTESYQELQFIDQELFNCSTYVDDDLQHDCIERIMEALPQHGPVRERNVSIVEICFAALIMAGIVSSYAFAGSSSVMASILPVSVLTLCSIVGGGLLIFLAKPIRRFEASITGRILHRRVHTAKADAFLYRCAGIAIVCGGAYMMWTHA